MSGDAYFILFLVYLCTYFNFLNEKQFGRLVPISGQISEILDKMAL